MSGTKSKSSSDRSSRVFVVHGRNEPARKAMFEFLRSIGLRPIEWSEARSFTKKASPYIGEILTAAFEEAQAVVVLQTPDDMAYLLPQLVSDGEADAKVRPQPRPNVMFEAGLAMGRDEDRVVLVEFGRVQPFSDLHGRHVVRLDNTVGKRQDLAHRLRDAGCDVQLEGNDWHTAGDLTPPEDVNEGSAPVRRVASPSVPKKPKLDATYFDGPRSSSTIQISNRGPGDVLDFDWDGDSTTAVIMRQEGDFPIARLPQGKSIKLMMIRTMGDGLGSHFNLRVTGRTEYGEVIDEELFVGL